MCKLNRKIVNYEHINNINTSLVRTLIDQTESSNNKVTYTGM